MWLRYFGADSLYSGRLPLGCRHCRRGAKMVLLITGLCDRSCFYCPLSREKKDKDVVYANELQVHIDDEILEEARSIRAAGTGITGGDPLCVPDRTIGYIHLLKTTFGGAHHIHLYTSTIDGELFQELERAGLDELRIHPMLGQWAHLESTGIAQAIAELEIPVGLEVPAIPGYEEELKALIRKAADLRLDFVNLNELEFSETNAERLLARGYQVKDDVSSAVLGSQELAIWSLVNGEWGIPLHYCSSSFKDRVQLRNRLLRRARHVAKDLDLITEEGLLLKGVVEGEDLEAVVAALAERGVEKRWYHLDWERSRVEVAAWVLEDLDDLPFPAFLVEEYPTADHLEVERTPLSSEMSPRKP